MAYARGRSWDILLWFFHVHEVFDKETGEAVDGFAHIAMPYLAHQAHTILKFKREGGASGMDSGSLLTIKNLSRQIKLCFMSHPQIPSPSSMDPDSVASLAFPDSQRYGVRRQDGADPYICKHHP